MKRLITILMVLVFTLSIVGCSSQGDKNEDSSSSAASSAGNNTGSVDTTPVSFTATLGTGSGDNSKSMAQKAWLELIQKKAGRPVNITFKYIPNSDYTEKFKLMVSSNSLTDFTQLPSFTDVTEAQNEGLFLDLAKYKESIPNYLNMVNQAFDGMLNASDADGHIYVFNPVGLPRFEKDKGLDPNSLTAYRYDVLEKNNLAIPTTLDEFYNAAVKLKQLYPDKYPVNVQFNDLRMLFAANHTSNDFYYDGKEYKFGPLDEGYKDALIYANKLYTEKLLDPEYLIDTTDTLQQKAFNDKNFMWMSTWFTTPGTWTNQVKNGKIFAVTYYPDNPSYGTAWQSVQNVNDVNLGVGWGGAVISSTVKNPKDILKIVDLSYDTDVIRLVTWGMEGTTYNIGTDGNPHFVDSILKAADAWAEGDKYGIRASRNYCPGFALADDSAAYVDFATNDYIVYGGALHTEPIEKSPNFTDVDLPSSKLIPPSFRGPTLQFTADEQQQKSTKLNAINTYRDEMQSKFIKGEVSFDNWKKFIDTLNSMGINDVQKIYNDALARYKEKKAAN